MDEEGGGRGAGGIIKPQRKLNSPAVSPPTVQLNKAPWEEDKGRRQGVPVTSNLYSPGDRLAMCVSHQKSLWSRDWSV